MFDPVDPKQSLPKLEHGILQYWREEDIFKRSMKQRTAAGGRPWHGAQPGESDRTFSFYDGPPFATGLPHYGHLLAGTIKDVIPRYQTMRGKYVQRRFGWDCHGLPVENLVEQENKIKDKLEIEKMGIAKFCELCCTSVQRYTKEWRQIVERMGRWVDMDWDYRTMDPEYMESIWWVVNQLNEKGLLYEGYKGMYICPRCATPLSNFEVTQGYRDRTDLSVIVTFPLKDDPQTILLAWTTTPWSLPGNLWLAIGPHIEYALVSSGGKKYILAKKLVEKVFQGKEYEILRSMKPEEIVGKKYEPLFPYFVDTILPSTRKSGTPETYGERANRTVINDAVDVSDEEGTGIVHITSSTGEDSYAVARSEGVDVLHHVTIDGHFVPAVKDFTELHVKPEGKDPMATDKRIIEELKKSGRFFSEAPFTHSYPHCWRCDTPLLPYTTHSWFVKVEEIKEKLLANNAKTEWVPAHMRDGRFGKWLEGARDWAISRNRYWGTPLPIWKCEETGDIEIVGSRDELMRRAPMRFSKVTALRHGESEGNLAPIYQSREPGTDLTKRGKQQAEAVGKLMAEGCQLSAVSSPLPVDVIYCSPLARTRQTAQAIADATGAEVRVDVRLREVEFGEYESKTVDFDDLSLVKARRAHKLKENAPESIYHFPGMETWQSVQDRIDDFLRDVLPKHRDQHIVIVTHADPVQNIRHFFTKEDPVKISHQPYPRYVEPTSYYWDHDRGAQMDLHKHAVDDIVWQGPQGQTFRRIPEVLDCWFESGSMPYAQGHYPFALTRVPLPTGEGGGEGKLPPGFPADFIAEGVDQTRGWFYTLMVLSTALFNEPAFHHCVVNGIVLAQDGKKMSKRLKNYPEPTELVEKHGADAIRFTLMSSPAVRGEDLRMSEKLVEETVRSVLLPLWNAYSFFVTYANAAAFEPTQTRRASAHPLDQWIRTEVQDLCNRMTVQLDAYDLSATCAELHETIDALTNWYIRLSRRRFAGKRAIAEEESASAIQDVDVSDDDQLDALHTLYDVLLTLSQLLAPFCPFITDAIYLNLVSEEHGSVHMTDWPEQKKLRKSEQLLLTKARVMRSIVSLGLGVRSEQKIKVRQPLQSAIVAIPPGVKQELQWNDDDLALLKAELNVKELTFTDDPGQLADVIAQVDARKVGPRLGARVQQIIAAGKAGEFAQQEDGTVLILDETLTPDEVQIIYRGKEGKNVAADRGVVVSVETTMTDELKTEGAARDLIRAIQRLRKETSLAFTDNIVLAIDGADDVLRAHGNLIAGETRSTLAKNHGEQHTIELGDRKVTVRFEKR